MRVRGRRGPVRASWPAARSPVYIRRDFIAAPCYPAADERRLGSTPTGDRRLPRFGPGEERVCRRNPRGSEPGAARNSNAGRVIMWHRTGIAAVTALAAAGVMTSGDARAADDAK